MKNLFFISLAFITLFFSCQKPEKYPNEPQIDYQKIVISEIIDTLGTEVVSYDLIFNALDGDSNLGLKQTDVTGIFSPDSFYHNNAFVTLYKKVDGEFVEGITYTDNQGIVHTDTLTYSQRIPYTDPVGLNDYFKAEIKINMQIEKIGLSNFFYDLDTIKFVFFVVDKDLNKSNIQETQEIIRGFRGTLIDTDTVIIY